MKKSSSLLFSISWFSLQVAKVILNALQGQNVFVHIPGVFVQIPGLLCYFRCFWMQSRCFCRYARCFCTLYIVQMFLCRTEGFWQLFFMLSGICILRLIYLQLIFRNTITFRTFLSSHIWGKIVLSFFWPKGCCLGEKRGRLVKQQIFYSHIISHF